MMFFLIKVFGGFNTQPPEGGWALILQAFGSGCCFNTQPPEGGWDSMMPCEDDYDDVSTHSRLKAAGARINKVKPCT
ncbi:hypothetical protein [Neisseria flavescens]|jgi:hypothetical protein|uniref:hypothetical protein n=1 Tax=Neisseria flavescens TaxID=484 RepID=UPI000A788D31